MWRLPKYPAIRLSVVATILAVLLVPVVMLACGSDAGGTAGEAVIGARVSDEGRTYTFDEFTAVGFKKNKTYDVSELPEAESAHYGFW